MKMLLIVLLAFGHTLLVQAAPVSAREQGQPDASGVAAMSYYCNFNLRTEGRDSYVLGQFWITLDTTSADPRLTSLNRDYSEPRSVPADMPDFKLRAAIWVYTIKHWKQDIIGAEFDLFCNPGTRKCDVGRSEDSRSKTNQYPFEFGTIEFVNLELDSHSNVSTVGLKFNGSIHAVTCGTEMPKKSE